MVYKQSTLNNSERKYIVDTVGPYPVTLLELDANNFTIAKAYIHANGQVLMQYNGDPNSADKYFYLHDRLGSIRALIDENGYVANCYLFSPSGLTFLLNGDTAETVENPFWFAGYNFDKVTYMYYCNARWYDPDLYRFTGRDPILGSFREPLTLHAYIYCLNDPINFIDPSGESLLGLLDTMNAMAIRGAKEGTSAGVACRALWMVKNIVNSINMLQYVRSAALFADTAWVAAAGLMRVGTVFTQAAYRAGETSFYIGLVKIGEKVGTIDQKFPLGTIDFIGSFFKPDHHAPFFPKTPYGVVGLGARKTVDAILEWLENTDFSSQEEKNSQSNN